MKLSRKSRFLTSVASAALVATAVVAIPTTAQAADPQCATASYVTQCAGAGASGAPYLFIAAANFNGTVFLWSHGIRPAINIPATLAPVGPYTITNAAEPGPGASSGDMKIINALVAAGYGVAGSGFSRQSLNVTEALKDNVELIAAFKKKFTTTKKVIAWGASLGTIHSQMLAEKYPDLVDGLVLGCPAANPNDSAMISYFGDALYGFKAFFDPSIKVDGYSADATVRAGEQLANIGKVLTVLGKLSAGLSSGAWPDTASPAGKALQAAGIPSRSALLLVGLMAGIPTRSKHVDGTSGPTGAAETYPLAVAPAVAILENMGTVGVAGSLLIADGELLTGGKVFDNSKTDYAARVAAERDIFSFALSGNSAVDAMLASLAATPRSTADAAAVAKVPSLLGLKGEINKPTVIMVAESDEYTPASIAQWYLDKNVAKVAAAKSAAIAAAKSSRSYTRASDNLVMLWAKTAAKYSKFTAAGSPDLSATPGAGTGHCLFTADQWLATAKMAAAAVSTGKFPNGGPITTAARKVGLSYDKKFSVPIFKSLQ